MGDQKQPNPAVRTPQWPQELDACAILTAVLRRAWLNWYVHIASSTRVGRYSYHGGCEVPVVSQFWQSDVGFQRHSMRSKPCTPVPTRARYRPSTSRGTRYAVPKVQHNQTRDPQLRILAFNATVRGIVTTFFHENLSHQSSLP